MKKHANFAWKKRNIVKKKAFKSALLRQNQDIGKATTKSEENKHAISKETGYGAPFVSKLNIPTDWPTHQLVTYSLHISDLSTVVG